MRAVVGGLCRYPVKGLGGESLDQVLVTRDGIEFDRALALPTGSIPLQPPGTWTTYDAFHTLISRAELGRSVARVVDGSGSPAEGSSFVEIADSERAFLRIPVCDGVPQPERASGSWSALHDTETAPVHQGVGLWDVADAPISIVNLASVRALSEKVGVELDPMRFRANIYLDGLPAWQEFGWLGRHISVGDVELGVFAPIERCRATSARPGGEEWDINVPGALAGHFGHIFCGLYARVIRPGMVAISDEADVIVDGPRISVDEGLLLDPAAPRWATVDSVTPLADDVHSLILRDPTGMIERAQAGQYLRLHGDGDQPGWRNYTVSGRADGAVRVTVRRETDGRFSPWLTSRTPGQRLLLSGPYGDSVLEEPAPPVVLATAGIGITPTLALLQALVEQASRAPVTVIHTARTSGEIPHWDEVLKAAQSLADCQIALFLTGSSDNGGAVDEVRASSDGLVRTERGRPTVDDLAPMLRDVGVQVFVCGPAAYVDVVRDAATSAGVEVGRLFVDPFYSPPDHVQERAPAPTPGPWTITWDDGTETTWVEADGTLLDHAEARGITAPAACRSGVCGTCSAGVDGSTATVLTPFAEAKGLGERLLCTVVPTADVRVDVLRSRPTTTPAGGVDPGPSSREASDV